MGYRIFIENKSKTLDYYGTKHYGYCSIDESELPSYKYLIEIGKFNGDEIFIGGAWENKIELTSEEFNRFIELYNAEYNSGISYAHPHNMLEEPSIIALMKDGESKEICWG